MTIKVTFSIASVGGVRELQNMALTVCKINGCHIANGNIKLSARNFISCFLVPFSGDGLPSQLAMVGTVCMRCKHMELTQQKYG